LFVGVRVTVPVDVGVIVNVCAVDELENVNTVGVESPPPEGVIVIVPVYVPFGVTVKLVDAVFTVPDVGPVRVKDVAEETPELLICPLALLNTAAPVVGGIVATGVTSNLIYFPISADTNVYEDEVAPEIAEYDPSEESELNHLNVDVPSATLSV